MFEVELRSNLKSFHGSVDLDSSTFKRTSCEPCNSTNGGSRCRGYFLLFSATLTRVFLSLQSSLSTPQYPYALAQFTYQTFVLIYTYPVPLKPPYQLFFTPPHFLFSWWLLLISCFSITERERCFYTQLLQWRLDSAYNLEPLILPSMSCPLISSTNYCYVVVCVCVCVICGECVFVSEKARGSRMIT